MYTIKVLTLWRHAAEMWMTDLKEDYGYGVTRTVSDDGDTVTWNIECSEINEDREEVIDRLERWLMHEYWFLNIE